MYIVLSLIIAMCNRYKTQNLKQERHIVHLSNISHDSNKLAAAFWNPRKAIQSNTNIIISFTKTDRNLVVQNS